MDEFYISGRDTVHFPMQISHVTDRDAELGVIYVVLRTLLLAKR